MSIPVAPHKALAEVSKIENLQERLVVVNHGWQSDPLMDAKVVALVPFEMIAVVTSPQLLDVVWCGAVVALAVL